jgi:hypothetical protein
LTNGFFKSQYPYAKESAARICLRFAAPFAAGKKEPVDRLAAADHPRNPFHVDSYSKRLFAKRFRLRAPSRRSAKELSRVAPNGP